MKKVIFVAIFAMFLIVSNVGEGFPVWALNDSNNTSTGNSTTTSQNETIAIPTSNATNSTIPNNHLSSNHTLDAIPPAVDSTSSVITPNQITINQGSQVQLLVQVSSLSNQSNISTGIVSWSDGNAGGTFNPNFCTISSGACTVSYVPSTNFNTVTITASYGGDVTHSGSIGTSILKVNIVHNVITTIKSNADTVYRGSQVTLSAVLTDNLISSSVPIGTITWSDNLGGTFSPNSCTVSAGSCSVLYTPPSNYDGSISITANYGGDELHSTSQGIFSLMINLHNTTTIVSPNIATINQKTSTVFTATVSDISNSQITPLGRIQWSDGNAGGIFTSSSCLVLSNGCSVSYIPPTNSSSITITASYIQDDLHSASSGTSLLTINLPHDTITTIVPNSISIVRGLDEKFTATVHDSSKSLTPTGTIFWSDGNSGGTFNPSSCVLSSGNCIVSYTPSTNSQNLIHVTGTYNGDAMHLESIGMAQFSIVNLPSSILLSTDQSYYAYGDAVTLSVDLPDQSLQNIAVGISDPNGDNIISRTITTDENGTGSLQFKIPNTYKTGVYQDVVNAIVEGKNYTNSTKFTVIKSHGLTIDSVQITNQAGDPVSMLKKGQNGFVKVSVSSGEKMPALLTLNLFDANQSSLGTSSIKSVVSTGTSQMTLSFFIPSDVQVGSANVFTNVYSDWPNNGGTPITTESCLAAEIQDPSNVSASYIPNPPHVCTSNETTTGITNTNLVSLTNDKAQITLGILLQNDSMTFMSPTEAHLLALAYENNTAANTKSKSIGVVNVNLDSMNKSNVISGNANSTQFTTLAGPDLQNNPMALKILQEIEASKRQVANIIGNETAKKLNEQLILQQRQAASANLKDDLTKLQQLNAANTTTATYAHFLTTVSDARSQAVFQDEFNFMKQRINVANTMMQNDLNAGDTWVTAVEDFNKYATISHVQMVTLNRDLNIQYGLADNRVQSCFDDKGQLTVIDGTNPCIVNVENNSTGSNGIAILSVQATDQQGNPVSLFKMGQNGYVKVVVVSNVGSQSLVTINAFDSNTSSLGTVSAKYAISPGRSEIILPYYVPLNSGTGLSDLYANVFTDWPTKGGVSQTNELSNIVGLS